MLGTVVALVRLAKFAHVVPGIALWSCALLMLCLSALTSLTSPEQLWRWAAAGAALSAPTTGRSLGLLVCLDCRLTVRDVKAARKRCPRCHAPLHERKPHSLAITAALLIAAAVLYVPANLLPVMDTRTFFDDESDTIMSGVLVLLQSGSWPIAVLVFVASIVVPLLKILALGVLLYSAWRALAARPLAAHPAVSAGGIHRPMVDARYLCHFIAGDAGASSILCLHHRRLGGLGLRRRRGADPARGAHFR